MFNHSRYSYIIFDYMKLRPFFGRCQNGCDFILSKIVQLCLLMMSICDFPALFNIGSIKVITNI